MRRLILLLAVLALFGCSKATEVATPAVSGGSADALGYGLAMKTVSTRTRQGLDTLDELTRRARVDPTLLADAGWLGDLENARASLTVNAETIRGIEDAPPFHSKAIEAADLMDRIADHYGRWVESLDGVELDAAQVARDELGVVWGEYTADYNAWKAEVE